jgi:hypothetical protein
VVDFGSDVGMPPVQVTGAGLSGDFAQAGSVAEVERIRNAAVAEMKQAREGLPAVAAPARYGFDRGIAEIQRQADRRIVELGDTPAAAGPDTARPSQDAIVLSTEAAPDDWFQRQARHIADNMPRLEQDPSLFKYAFMGSVPSALFVLVPLFALLLKLFYLGSGRLYLEHLVVALYSHAFLCLALLGQFALLALDHLVTPHLGVFGILTGLLAALLWLWMPGYLLLMQKRVYRQGWALTAIKFVVIGGIYAFVLIIAVAVLALISLAHA